VKCAHNGTAATEIFFYCGQIPFHASTPNLDPQICKCFPLKKVFRYGQVPFKTGVSLLVYKVYLLIRSRGKDAYAKHSGIPVLHISYITDVPYIIYIYIYIYIYYSN
jgi:hypothetical protein